MNFMNWRVQLTLAASLGLSLSAPSVTAQSAGVSSIRRKQFTVKPALPVGLPTIDESLQRHPVLEEGAIRALVDRETFFEPEFASRENGLARVELPKTGDRPFKLTDVRSGQSVGIRLLDARAVSPELSDGIVVYPSAVVGGSYLHRVHPGGTEDYVLFRKPVTEELRYEVELERGVAGLRRG